MEKEKSDAIIPEENESYNDYINRIIQIRGQWGISNNVYYENHHIVPRCMGGEPKRFLHNTKHENLIWLLPEEHYMVHVLLCLENPNNKDLIYAWNTLNNTNKNDAVDYLNPSFAKSYGDLKRRFSKIHSEEVKRLQSGENNPFYGKKHSEASKIKMSQSHKDCFKNSDLPHKMLIGHSKPIICIETNQGFLTAKLAGENVGVNKSTISKACNGKLKTAKGYHWRYANQKESLEIKKQYCLEFGIDYEF